MFLLLGVFGSSHARPASAASSATSPVTVSLEFDDGVSDQLQAAAILDAHGMHGVFFVNSGRLGLPGHMTLADVRDLEADGHEIGGHTVSHADLPTLSLDEQQRQVCNDRTALLNAGLQVYDFAYPFGDYTADTGGVVQGCGYNSARSIGGVVSPSSCSGCDWAETIPPRLAYAMITPDSIKASNTLEDLQGYVTEAEQHGGGWVQLVMHHVCSGSGCDTLSVDPSMLSSFLDWLQARGTPVKTVHEMIGGALAPPVVGPSPPFNDGVLRNGDLELPVTRTSSTVPDCWSLGGAGTTTASGKSSSDAHSGSWGYRIDVSSVGSGADKKLFSKQDLGACAPGAAPGDVHQLSAWYKTNAQARFVAYYRTSAGGWVWWAQQAANLPTTSSYRQATWTLPAVPSEATAISVAMSIRSVGFVTVDDFALVDTGDDATPPAVQITSPADGASVAGIVPVRATASDNVGVAKVEFYADGQLVGTATSAPYEVMWNTSTASKPNLGLTAKAYDAAGNVAISQGVNVTIQQTDAVPPGVSLVAPVEGATVSGTAVTLTADASDDVAVTKVEFSRGTTPIGTATTTPYQLTWDTTPLANGTYTLTATAYDAAGNTATSTPITVTVTNTTTTNPLQNPSLETATTNVPTCWQLGSAGTNTATWTWTTDAHTGSHAQHVQITTYTSGDRKLVIKQDTGTCAPTITPGTKYTLGAYYKSTTPTRFILFYRNTAGTWVYWTESPTFPPSTTWTPATWTTPTTPTGATNISFGLGITAAGTLTQDDLSLTGAP